MTTRNCLKTEIVSVYTKANSSEYCDNWVVVGDTTIVNQAPVDFR